MILLEIDSKNKKQIHYSKGDINMNSQKDMVFFKKIFLDD